MATDKQIAANRRNAQRSTGPKTASGKQRVSRNAIKHGLATSPGEREVGRIADQIQNDIGRSDSVLGGERIRELAELESTIRRARSAKAKLLGAGKSSADWTERLDEYRRLDRYERRALSRKKMLLRQLG